MPYRPLPFKFAFLSTTRQTRKWIVNDLPTTLNDKIYPQIPFMIREKKYAIKNLLDNTPKGRLFSFTRTVTDLLRDERLVLKYNRATEIRPYVDRLIAEAIRYGDKHRPTMALANYWLRDKKLIHKLFKEFVPRYENQAGAFTAIHRLGEDYAKFGRTMTEWKENHGDCLAGGGQAVLEMRGHPHPPIIRPRLNRHGLLTNVLLDGARLENIMSKSNDENIKQTTTW